MTIRYEANPPKILPDVDVEESIKKFIVRIKDISKKCDAIHLTENVLGYERVSPLEVGKIIKKEIPDLPITVSLRVRDKTEKEIFEFVENCIDIGFSGILVLMGDPSQTGKLDSGEIPTFTIKKLKEKNLDAKIDLYLSVSNKPNFSKLGKKTGVKPKGFMTQVVHNIQQVQALADNLKDFSVIPIILFPSQKNEKSAKFLDLNLESYSKEFEELLKKSHKITGDVLLTSPNDFTGLNEFLSKTNL
jgi:5,10-methylenetetrahydrofolate reductase